MLRGTGRFELLVKGAIQKSKKGLGIRCHGWRHLAPDKWFMRSFNFGAFKAYQHKKVLGFNMGMDLTGLENALKIKFDLDKREKFGNVFDTY